MKRKATLKISNKHFGTEKHNSNLTERGKTSQD